MPREKSRYRERRNSSNSSESSYERKKSKSKHKRRSRSRERSETSHKRKRSSSRSRHRRRSYSRSASRDRYNSRTKRRSRSKPKRLRRSISRERSYSRSSSRSRSKKKYTKKSSKRSKSSSSKSSNSFDIEPAQPNKKKVNLDDTDTKIEKAIKAAEAAGLTMTKIPTYEYKEVEIKEDMPTIHDRNLLAELNSDTFMQKSFTSSRSKKQNIVIDLNAQTVTVPESEVKKDDSIIDFDEIPTEEELKEMWIKKLYTFRKRMLRGEI